MLLLRGLASPFLLEVSDPALIAINLQANSEPVPDFRSSTGLFKSLKSEHKLKASGKQLFDASVYQTDSSTSTFHDMVRSMSELVKEARPTAFHNMLSDLALEGQLLRLYTQNVDGLDVELPCLNTEIPLNTKGPWPPTIQLHGGLAKMTCSKCSKVADFDPSLFNGPEPPPCTFCVEADRVRTDHAGKRSHGIGRLRPRMVLYNEQNPDQDAIGSVVSADLRARPDAVIVVGTSMKIPGVRRIVREMCGVVRSRRDGLAVWINRDPPPPGKEFEDCWDLVVKGACDEVASQFYISRAVHKACTDSDVEAAKGRNNFQVMIPSPTKQGTQMLTPAASPAPKPAELRPKITLKLKTLPMGATDKKLTTITKASKPGKAKGAGKAASKPNAKTSNLKRPVQKNPAKRLTSTFKITKSTETNRASAVTRAKLKSTPRSDTSTPKSTARKSSKQQPSSSSPLSSPTLPSYKPSPLTPSKTRTNTPTNRTPSGPLFPGLLKLPPIDFASKLARPDPLSPPIPNKISNIQVQITPLNHKISSSPPPYSPLSSPVLGPSKLEAAFSSTATTSHSNSLIVAKAESGVETSDESFATALSNLSSRTTQASRPLPPHADPFQDRDPELLQLQTPPHALTQSQTREEEEALRPNSSSSLSSAGSMGSRYSRTSGTVSPSSVPRGMESLLCL